MNIAFIGGGNMAAALIGGMVARGFDPHAVRVVDPAESARTRLASSYGVQCFASLDDCDRLGDVIVLAVKPQQMRAVCEALAPHVRDQLILSIAAGIRLGDLARWLGGHQRLARCMPNTPALIGLGVTGLYAASAVNAAQREACQRILEAVGQVIWVNEEALLDAVTAVSGSGPAYVFYIIEALQRAAEQTGLDAASARRLVLETLRGATELAARSEEPVSVLRERVTSKGGTTERALATLNERGVAEAIVAAVEAARRRATELGEALGKD
ncbi:MAG: pyrroline-5-carboxylate reductase [Pseudomonadota bacterium]|nr:MAG: pyrroline-5-carboxylate reductase [Pseudomonadota bacterium]